MNSSPHLDQFRLLAQYNSWANDRLYALLSTLTEEEWQRNMGAFFGSIHGTLNHLLLGDRIWLRRFATGTPHKFSALENAKLIFEFHSLADILYPKFAEFWQERKVTDQAIEQWMSELDPEMLTARVCYQNVSGIDRNHSLWFGLTHFFNHQTHHRAQVTTLLQQLGYDYGATDFLMMYDIAKDFV
ncbi:DinB family protein [Microcoleus sp. FACHB-1515]|uniref:DinB family protein n=1 Tax=Cyanophyceae TaxID=3028117 RepID=UPI0016854EF3|nr:DinB family protein [Microcoleus sp. FACHB-1515]MBD2091263.1 DinB family protein [Microcoleus sp. FACHB-1515]